MKITYIYGLVDPRDNEIRYVGKSDNPKKRYQIHTCRRVSIEQIKSNPTWYSEKELWIFELKQVGLFPALVILEECKRSDYKEAEKKWVKKFSKNGRWLTNGAIHKASNRYNKLQIKYIMLYGSTLDKIIANRRKL